ncbi:unnamed protein product [Adineta steineri]|uniref:NADPH oxidase 5 n=1 Tax=Adineta steineri TaxID=433720 RepID=A0A814LL54_9BILA|nr:unnamed protein product [Adineta steineri]
MKFTTASSSHREALLQKWQRHLHGHTNITFQELLHLFRQRQLLETLFSLFDRDSSGLLSESEWIGSIYKVAETANRTKDVRSLETFTHSYRHMSHDHDSLSLSNFCKLFEDSSFRRHFASLFLGESDTITVMEFIDILRAVSNVKSDTKWLSWLAYQFHMIAGKQRHHIPTEESVNLETFKNSFYFKVPQLAECLFNYLDVHKTGRLTLENFIQRLEFIVEANNIEKVEFLFKIFDHDDDGIIEFYEMKLLLRCFLEQSPSLDLEETLAELTATLFKETDVDRSGDISLEELTSAFRRNEHLFKVLSLSTHSWIQPKPVSISKNYKRSLTIRSWIRNNIGLVFFWSLYLFICFCISINVIRVYLIQQQAHFLIIIARINGGMLNFNCALVLLLMLRKHITWLRTKGGGVFLPLDHHIDIHKIIGIIILVEALLHTIAHLAYLGYVFYVCALARDCGFPCQGSNHSSLHYHLYNESSADPSILTTRYHYDHTINKCDTFQYHGCGGNWNNFHTEVQCSTRCKPYRETGHSYLDALLTTRLGLGYITGVIEFVIGAIFYIMCLPFVRKSGYFQLFYWCHMLCLPWLLIMLLHGPHFWKWLLIPGFLYLIEKIRRYHKSRSNKHGETFIMEAILLPSQVIHLVINKPRKFRYKPGDYIYINIPAVASFEWHPFSISSAPEHKDSLWLHVRACGHWTRRVYDLFRAKLHQEHGFSPDDNSHTNLRSSMRSRMSRSYISELRGSVQADTHPQADVNKNERILRSSIQKNTKINPKVSSLSLPQVKFMRRSSPSSPSSPSCHSAISLCDRNSSYTTNQLFDSDNNTSDTKKEDTIKEDTIKEDIEAEETETEYTNKEDIKKEDIKTEVVLRQAPHKHNNKLTVPPVGDYCIRISNTPSMVDEQQELGFNDSRLSDALGYLRMYKNRNRVQLNTLQFDDREDLEILIDGPYGAPSQHIFEAEHAVLIAAGIGITPFASILQSIMCRYRNLRHKCPNCEHIWDNPQNDEPFVKKVDFIWVTREQRSLEWFISLLARMEIEQQHLRQNSDKGPLLEVHLYVTSAKSAADLKALNVYLSLDLIGRENAANCDAVDRLRQRTKHGRPDWDQVFGDLLCAKKGKISVFYCGPPALSGILTTKCRQYGFAYKKELF